MLDISFNNPVPKKIFRSSAGRGFFVFMFCVWRDMGLSAGAAGVELPPARFTW